MITQPNTKVTFKSLAEICGCFEQEVKDLLKSHNLTPENLTQVQIDSVKAQLTKGDIQMIKPNVHTVKNPVSLNGDTSMGKVTMPVSNAVSTVETAKDRREVAAATVMTSGQDAVSKVLEKATQKANDLIAAKLESLSDTLADKMAQEMEDEILKTVDFFGRMLTQGTDRTLGQIGEVMEGEFVQE